MPIDSHKEPEIEFVVALTKLVTEKYNSKISVEKYKRDPNIINCHIGNSGFNVRLLENPNHIKFVFDYYPNVEDLEKNRAVVSSIFGSALLSFRNWLNDPEIQKDYNLDNKKFSNLANFTNDKMVNFTRKLFSENGHPEMIKIDESGIGTYLQIDIDKFCKLKESDTLIQYLKRLDERTKNTTLTYNKNLTYK